MAEFLTPDICVIGGGAGGLAVATRARAHGASVIVVEPGPLGGDSLRTGAIPSKALVAAGRRAHYLRTAGPFGIANAEPNINARAVFDHVHRVIEGAAPAMTPEHLHALGIDVLADEGRFLDRRTLAAGTRQVRARRFVIATGSRPVVPDIAGLGDVPFFTSASIVDNPRKLTHLVIIGAGPIGAEMAQAFRRLGSEVTLVDHATPLADYDPELVEIALRQLAEEGVAIHPATEVTAVQQRSLGIGVVIRSAAGEAVLDASHILVATGRVPSLDGLALDKAGIRRDAATGSLVLAPTLRTSNRRVYAVGDAVGGARHTHVAAHHADLVVRQALFGLPARFEPARLPIAVFTDPELAQIGLSEPAAARRGGGYRVLRLSLAENDRARIERQAYGLVKLVVDPGGRLLGAGVVGPGAAELLSLFTLAIANRLSIRHFRSLLAPYPSLAEIVRQLGEEAARSTPANPWLARLLALRRLLP